MAERPTRTPRVATQVAPLCAEEVARLRAWVGIGTLAIGIAYGIAQIVLSASI